MPADFLLPTITFKGFRFGQQASGSIRHSGKTVTWVLRKSQLVLWSVPRLRGRGEQG
jgi:hypothetical protein